MSDGLWYPTSDGKFDGARAFRYRARADQEMVAALKKWVQLDDPRDPAGAIVLVLYPDGFGVRYLGPDAIDQAELVRRVVWIGDSLREATETPE
jgi:hypothetical protein